MTKLYRRDKIFIPIINFLIRRLTSQQYQKRLNRVIRLGMIKAVELHHQVEATDARLAGEPGMTPGGEIIQP
jgi:hypothetical protein